MKIKAAQAGIIFIVFMISGIVLSMVSGYWATEGSRIPARFTEGKFAGINNPADIRGSYSLEDIEKSFDISVVTLAQAFGLSGTDNPSAIQVKSFEAIYGILDGKEIGTDSMRYFVALYKGLPYTPEEDTALPRPAVAILKKESALSDEQLKEVNERVVFLESAVTGEVSAEHTDTEEMLIKGKTTFAQLYEWGITKEELEGVLGIPVGARGKSVRDYCMDNEMEFSTVKYPIQDILDNKF